MNIVYLGYNSFLKFKRGVENVIIFQSISFPFSKKYYIHWDQKTYVYKYSDIICIGLKKNFFWPLRLNIIVFRLLKSKISIIHSHNPLMSFFLYTKTLILTVHDALAYQNSNNSNIFFNNIILKFVEKIVYLKSIHVHFISFFTKSKALFDGDNFSIIYNTCFLENKSIQSVNYSSSFENDIISVLIVRSIERRARIDLLIQVAEKLQNSNYKFTIAGKGPLLDKYKNVIKEKNLNNIQMLGYVPDELLVQLYSKTDVVLMVANDSEGFGLPIIEGYLFDKPVIASNVCAIPEIIISESFLFNNNADDIIEKLLRIDLNIRSVYSKYYFNNFSNSVIFPKYYNLYSRYS